MSAIRKPVRQIIIEIEGDLDIPSPGTNFIGHSVSISLDSPIVSGLRASMKRGESSEMTVNVKCTAATVVSTPFEE